MTKTKIAGLLSALTMTFGFVLLMWGETEKAQETGGLLLLGGGLGVGASVYASRK